VNAPLKLAFIIPRYHVPQAGGAEFLAEATASRLAKKGHAVEVLTTCAVGHIDWKNELPEGTQYIDGVKVQRFKVDPRLHYQRFILLQQRLDRGWPLSPKEEIAWMTGNIHSKALYEAIRRTHASFDALIFAPYLFGITYQGLQIVPEKSFLIPCLHDESYAHMQIFHDFFHKPAGILFNASAEKELAKKLYGLKEEKCAVAGMGFDSMRVPENQNAFRQKFGIANEPFIFYAGRREKGKNIPLLVDFFLAYKKNHPNDLKLVIAGSGDFDAKGSEHIIDIGFIPREELFQAYEQALAVCQPSINESFSIILMESWLMNTPVLVHERCSVTRDHVKQSGGGLWFKSYFEFEECLETFLCDEKMRMKMGVLGGQYVTKEFKWDRIIENMEAFIQKRLRA
jgi:glycosyltransferase involved in cell wall biosynthesis